MSLGPIGVWDLIVFMQEHGSSLLMNWGEDDQLWEVSWITSGIRFTGVSAFLDDALLECKNQADMAKNDARVYGKSLVKDGKRIDPKHEWWCCTADYPNHDPDCPNQGKEAKEGT